MSDIEHELLTDVGELQASLRQVAELARRALLELRDLQGGAQDADGGHDPWVDAALADVDAHLAAISPDDATEI